MLPMADKANNYAATTLQDMVTQSPLRFIRPSNTQRKRAFGPRQEFTD